MSNSATIIPAIFFGLPTAVVVGGIAAVKWLTNITPEDVAAVECLKEQQRRERLLSARRNISISRETPVRLTSASLHQRSAEPLQRTSEKLGYRIVRPVSRGPHILLARPSGEKLAIYHANQGKATVTANNERCLRNLVRCHTVDRAIGYLQGKGMNIQTTSLPNGEIRITGYDKVQVTMAEQRLLHTSEVMAQCLWMLMGSIATGAKR